MKDAHNEMRSDKFQSNVGDPDLGLEPEEQEDLELMSPQSQDPEAYDG